MIADIDNWREIIATLKTNKLRATLTAFGVFWGIFMLIIMLGSGKGLENGVQKDFSGTATNSLFIWARTTTIPFKGYPRGRRFTFKNSDISALRTNLPQIEYLAPRIQLRNANGENNVIRGLKTGVYDVNGDYPDFQHIKLMDLLQGRFLNDLDIQEKRKVVVIGERVYKDLFEKDERAIDEYIEISGVYFKVIGVFRSKDENDPDESRSKTLAIPFTTFQQAFNYGDRVEWFSLTSAANYPASDLVNDVIRLLADRHQVSPDDDQAFGYWNMEKEFSKIVRLFSGIRFLIWFVGVFTLIAGVIGVSNIMLIVVKERTREFGIKRALGATPFHIVSQIMLETILLTAFSGYFGLVAGVGVVEGTALMLKKFQLKTGMFDHPEIDFNVAMIAILTLIIGGALAGLIPAYRAVSIKPVEAIREE